MPALHKKQLKGLVSEEKNVPFNNGYFFYVKNPG